MKNCKKTVGVLTTTRADYGILCPLIKKMMEDSFFNVKVLVTGTHLSPLFGNTVNEIKNDNVSIACEIDILSADNSAYGISETMSNATVRFAEFFRDNSLDALVVLGDRYETFAVCIAAMNERIPIIHIHGGETTEGAIDECIRHSITKMSQLHLTSTEEYRKRVIQLGENPERVFNVGSIGVENVKKMRLFKFQELKDSIGADLNRPYAIVTFHPVTLENNSAINQINELLSALDEHNELYYIFTLSNADCGGANVNETIKEYAKNRNNVYAFASLGVKRYLSAVKYATMVIGNSSSGIIEVPSFGIPTINIGDRQKGRVQAESIINCEPKKEEICVAIDEARNSSFYELCQQAINPYEKENSCRSAIEIIKKYLKKDEKDLKKKFYNLSD